MVIKAGIYSKVPQKFTTKTVHRINFGTIIDRKPIGICPSQILFQLDNRLTCMFYLPVHQNDLIIPGHPQDTTGHPGYPQDTQKHIYWCI